MTAQRPILCIGTTPALARSMRFDRLALDAVNRAVEVRVAAAGKAVNVARALRTLGFAPLCTGFLGGASGQEHRADLDAAGIAHEFVEIAAPTRVCVTVIDAAAGQATELVEEAPAAEEQAWRRLASLVERRMPGCAAAVMSGALAAGGAASFYAECCRVAGAASVPAIVDARDAPLALTLPLRPAWIKPNRAELASTLGLPLERPDDVVDGARRLIERGAQRVLVTMGADGAIAADAREAWLIRPPALRVVSAIGSGDAACAALAASLVAGRNLLDAARHAVACGSANALRLRAGEIDPGDVARIEAACAAQRLC